MLIQLPMPIPDWDLASLKFILQNWSATVDEIVIDANMDLQWPHGMSLMPPSPTCNALIPYRVGLCLEAPCTQLTRSRTHTLGFWCHHFAEDVEDPADDAEDPRDGLEALVDVGEAHEVLESLMKTMMPLQRSWSPLIWWHDGTLMKSLMLKILLDLDEIVPLKMSFKPLKKVDDDVWSPLWLNGMMNLGLHITYITLCMLTSLYNTQFSLYIPFSSIDDQSWG